LYVNLRPGICARVFWGLSIGRLVVVFVAVDGDVNDNVNERMAQAVPCG